jgi:general secretion pathway protein D
MVSSFCLRSHNVKGKLRQLAILGIAVSLASCSVTDNVRSNQPSGQRSTGPLPTVAPVMNNVSLQTLGNVAVADSEFDERQALIDEINRDGRRGRDASFRETVPAPVQAPANNIVALNYEQADLRDVLAELADALDIAIILDPSIDTRVSLRTANNRPLSYADIWPLVRLLVREHGLVMEQTGNIWVVRPGGSNLPLEIATPGTIAIGTAAQVMQITPLLFVSASSVLELLTPLLDADGRVTRIANTNSLAITAGRSQLARVNELLALIDDDPFRTQGLQLYPLSNALASDVAKELNDILTLIEGPAPAYRVQGLDRINALLVTAPATRGFDEITRWIKLLDADREEQAEQLFQYRVKNLNAMDLARTLTEVFKSDDSAVLGTDSAAAGPQRSPEAMILLSEAGEARAVTQQFSGSGSEIAVSANIRVSIVADEPTNSLLIRANPRDYRQLLATISQLDTAPLQVMINAVIAQIVLTDDSSFGVDWSRVMENVGSASRTNIATGFMPTRGDDGSSLGGLLFTRAFLDGAARVEATLEAIAINNDVRLLARPSLTVINNQEGLIRIGAEVPVQLGETVGIGGSATTNIQYRPTGIELQITPRINDDGVVNLTIRQELSSVSGSAGINQNPIFQNQEIETTVVVRDGENVVLGGLIQNSNDLLNTGVPYLNRVPGLGRLFSYQQDNNERRELFIVLRPEIVNLNSQTEARYREILSRFELAAQMVEDF